jgi:hypothetical protein
LQQLVAGEAEFIYPMLAQAVVLGVAVAQQRGSVAQELEGKVMQVEQQAVQELAVVEAQEAQALR